MSTQFGEVTLPASISMVRTFDAPREAVYRTWTDAAELRTWFAPDGYEVLECETDPRTGGKWRVRFSSGSGEVHEESGEYRDVVEPSRLTFTLTQRALDGGEGPETLVEVDFIAHGDTTEMRFRQGGCVSAAMRDGNAEGWNECLDKLASRLRPDGAAEIRKLLEDWWDASAAKDMDAIMRPIAQDVESYEHDEPLVYRGADAVRAVCQTGFDYIRGEFRWEIPDVRIMVRDDLAVVWGLNRIRTTGTDGTVHDLWSRGTRVFRKFRGEWKLIHQHLSFPYDPATGMARTDLTPEEEA